MGTRTMWRLLTTNEELRTWTRLRRCTPGEILKEEFLVPLGITNNELAMSIRVPASRVDQIVKGNRSITADTALRLAQYFGNSPQFWMNLQSQYDLRVAVPSLEQIRREVVRRSLGGAKARLFER